MDILTKKERSKRMSLIRSKWTKQEKKVHNMLKGRKIKHKMHPKIPGNPDLLINSKKAVFLHGCFWHKCPKHYKKPSSNKAYWMNKVEQNAKRDSKNKRILRSIGYNVASLWEHDINSNIHSCLKRLEVL